MPTALMFIVLAILALGVVAYADKPDHLSVPPPRISDSERWWLAHGVTKIKREKNLHV